jgi:hypothetical protein
MGKIILYSEMAFGRTCIAIPKTRGIGFLKSPVGQHVNKYSDFITNLGFDSGCEVNFIIDVDTNNDTNIEKELLKPLSQWLGFPYEKKTFDEIVKITEGKTL